VRLACNCSVGKLAHIVCISQNNYAPFTKNRREFFTIQSQRQGRPLDVVGEGGDAVLVGVVAGEAAGGVRVGGVGDATGTHCGRSGGRVSGVLGLGPASVLAGAAVVALISRYFLGRGGGGSAATATGRTQS
jgi:hypothetical protein